MKNFESLAYTYRHRKAFRYTVDKIVKDPADRAEMLRRAEEHDLDKMYMYLSTDKKLSSEIHRRHARHHLTDPDTLTRYDLMEAVIDWECAEYTKPDKPDNAYDAITKTSIIPDDIKARLFGIMEELGIARSYRIADDAYGMEAMKAYEMVTPADIYREVAAYSESRDLAGVPVAAEV